MVQVIAHRGARSLAPENTMAAAVSAFNIGADLWETDIQMTQDGHLVLFHDDTLIRCTDVKTKFPSKTKLPVSGFTRKELLTLDAGSFYLQSDPFGQLADGAVAWQAAENFKGEKIPTLEQALEFTKVHKWKINIELKCLSGSKNNFELVQAVIKAVAQSAIDTDRVVVSSFYHPWLDYLVSKSSGVETQALVGDDDQDSLDFEDFRFDTYNVNADMIRENDISVLKQRHKKINLFTVNDPSLFRKYADLGVDGIFTDFPQRFVSVGG